MTKRYTVDVTLYVAADDERTALDSAQSILAEAGGRDGYPDTGDDRSAFGFALLEVKRA